MNARQQITAATYGSSPGFPPLGEREGGSWIGGDAYSSPAVAVKEGANTTYYYLLRDYLGNITHLVNTSNSVVSEYTFGAWGRRRDKDTWSYTLSGEPDLLAGRGFTSHEWLPWFNLYNMNGRLYDPVVGRFLSADNYVQMADFTQSFNRYSYCLNNPLKFTDPSGEKVKWWHPVAAIFGTAAWGSIFKSLQGEQITFGEFMGSYAVNAASFIVGAGVGNGINSLLQGGTFIAGATGACTASSSFLGGAAGGFAGGFISGTGNSLMNNSHFGDALWDGTKSGFIGGAIGGLVGGIDAGADGRNFWHGGTKTVDVSLPITQVNQAGPYDCNYACAESVDGYYGKGRNQSYFQTLEPGNGQGLTDIEIGRMYGKAGYGARPISLNTSNPVSTVGDIANTMSANKAVVLNYYTGNSGGVNSAGQRIVFGHATVVTRVRIFDNGRFIIKVMNPGKSTTRFTNANLFHLIFGVY
jgi:RHS repeat-associated protein